MLLIFGKRAKKSTGIIVIEFHDTSLCVQNGLQVHMIKILTHNRVRLLLGM